MSERTPAAEKSEHRPQIDSRVAHADCMTSAARDQAIINCFTKAGVWLGVNKVEVARNVQAVKYALEQFGAFARRAAVDCPECGLGAEHDPGCPRWPGLDAQQVPGADLKARIDKVPNYSRDQAGVAATALSATAVGAAPAPLEPDHRWESEHRALVNNPAIKIIHEPARAGTARVLTPRQVLFRVQVALTGMAKRLSSSEDCSDIPAKLVEASQELNAIRHAAALNVAGYGAPEMAGALPDDQVVRLQAGFESYLLSTGQGWRKEMFKKTEHGAYRDRDLHWRFKGWTDAAIVTSTGTQGFDGAAT